MDNELLELLGTVNQEEELHFDYITDLLRNAMNRLFSMFADGNREERGEVIDYLYLKVDACKPTKSAYYYSLIANMTDDPKDIVNFLEFVTENERYSLNEKYFLYYQIKSIVFRHFKADHKEIIEAKWMLFQNIIDGFRAELAEELQRVPEEERDDAFVIVLTEQMIYETHAPTKTALDRCHVIQNVLGKNILLINTAEVLSNVGRLPFVGEMEAAYEPANAGKEYMEWKGSRISFFQCNADTPNIPATKMVLDVVKEKKPQFIVNIGTSSVIASLMAAVVPVISVALNFRSLDPTETTYQTLGRGLNEMDREILAYAGKGENHVIESRFTFSLKDQTTHLGRKELSLPEDAFVICVIGVRLDDEVDDAFLSMLEGAVKDRMAVVFAGRFTKLEKLERYPNLKAHFHFAGMQKDILAFLDNCDLCLNPHRVGGGTSAVEPLSKGVPVITLRFGDVWAVVGEDFAVDTFDEMAAEIERYRTDPKYYEKKSAMALDRADLMMDSGSAFVEVLTEMAQREGFEETLKNDRLPAELAESYENAMNFEKLGQADAAISMLRGIVLLTEEKNQRVFLELAEMEYRNGYEKEALNDFIHIYERTGDSAVRSRILEYYYEPKRAELSATAEANIQRLKEYALYCGPYEVPVTKIYPVWKEEGTIIGYDRDGRSFVTYEIQEQTYASEGNNTRESHRGPMLINALFAEEILDAEQRIRVVDPINEEEDRPVYVGYEEKYWGLFLRSCDIDAVLEPNRLFLIAGIPAAKTFFDQQQILFPQEYTKFHEGERVEAAVVATLVQRMERGNLRWTEAAQYYSENADEIRHRIAAGKPRILFRTTLFSTAIRYHARDCMAASEKLGLDCRMFMEKSGLHGVSLVDEQDALWEFRPDVIFNIDHFRYENIPVPENCFYVTWIQDPMGHIMDKATPKRLGGKMIMS